MEGQELYDLLKAAYKAQAKEDHWIPAHMKEFRVSLSFYYSYSKWMYEKVGSFVLDDNGEEVLTYRGIRIRSTSEAQEPTLHVDRSLSKIISAYA